VKTPGRAASASNRASKKGSTRARPLAAENASDIMNTNGGAGSPAAPTSRIESSKPATVAQRRSSACNSAF